MKGTEVMDAVQPVITIKKALIQSIFSSKRSVHCMNMKRYVKMFYNLRVRYRLHD